MSNVFKVEIVNPEKSFLTKEDVTEVVVPAFEGDMGILKDHISIISFLRPGLLRIIDSKSSEETFYVEDGIIEFKNKVRDILIKAEKEGQNPDISDQAKYLVNHKIEVLKSLTLN